MYNNNNKITLYYNNNIITLYIITLIDYKNKTH